MLKIPGKASTLMQLYLNRQEQESLHFLSSIVKAGSSS